MSTPNWPKPWPPTLSLTADTARELVALFDVADELSATPGPDMKPVTLDDLDDAFTGPAEAAAKRHGLAWPPNLAEVSAFFNEHGNAVKAALR